MSHGRDLDAAWKRTLVRLVALRGDSNFEAFIKEKHAELNGLLFGAGGPRATDLGDEAVQRWFKRKLRSRDRGGSKEQLSLCRKLGRSVDELEAPWLTFDAPRLEEALRENKPEEGPMICVAWAKELEGSRFDGIWISREKPGIYRVGDEQLRIAAQVLDGKLLVHGHFEGDLLHPARVPMKTFLQEHGPASMRAVVDQDNDLFGAADDRSRSPRKASEELPTGWTKRESRSKPGIFYYVHEGKGLSQMERPTEPRS